VDFGRADKRVFIWGNEELYIIKERKLSKKNILGKEFKELDNFVRITKGAVPMDDVLRLIYKD